MTEHNAKAPPRSTDGFAGGVVSDILLMARIRSGDRAALAELYDRYAARLLGLACRMLPCRNDGEDLLHDVFLEAWHRADGYDPERGSVIAWLMLRLRSRALDRLRSAKAARARGLVEPLAEDYPAPPGGDPCNAVESAETQQTLQRLTPVQREVIEQMYFQGLSCSEIAARCDIPAGTVKSRLSSALTRLRQTRFHDQDQCNER